MRWLKRVGLTPTRAGLARKVLRVAARSGVTGWSYDDTREALCAGEQVVNLANIHLEYVRASLIARPALLRKYVALLTPSTRPDVPALWSLAQSRIFPLLRSRFERTLVDIDCRRRHESPPPRASRPYFGHLEQVIGYDQGATVVQVSLDVASGWGISIAELVDRALVNLRSLPHPQWEQHGEAVWRLASDEGYQECYVQLPSVFARMPGKGASLAMIPNRGVLLATGSDEPGGPAALVAAARTSLLEAPWPLCAELFRNSPSGAERCTDTPALARSLAALERLDIASVYKDQQEALQALAEAEEDDVYVASFSLMGRDDDADDVTSWCSWSEGVPSLLPATDVVAFVRDPSGTPETLLIRWDDARRIVGHYLRPTTEDPPRMRVEAFPTQAEWALLQDLAITR